MPRIFITRSVPGPCEATLAAEYGEEAVAVHPEDANIGREELLARVQGAEALITMLSVKVDEELLEAAGPQLKVVSNFAVGYDNMDLAAASERGVWCTNTPDVLTEATADVAWTLLMSAARRSGEAERHLRAGRWEGWAPKEFLGVDIVGKTLGLLGMGRIGQAVARRARGFDMEVLYHNRNRLAVRDEEALNARYVDKETLLRESDFLSVHCPLTSETRHSIDAAAFDLMKPTAVLINTARGPVVDEAALAQALRDGRIFGAGLDVFEKEPAIHPDLVACPNAVLLPHIGSATHETRGEMGMICARAVMEALAGKEPPNCLNPRMR